MKTVLVIGGTGAQGVPVVKALADDSKYAACVITRNASSKDALALAVIPGVSIFKGRSYYEPTLREALKGKDYVFINTNGFTIGKIAEIY